MKHELRVTKILRCEMLSVEVVVRSDVRFDFIGHVDAVACNLLEDCDVSRFRSLDQNFVVDGVQMVIDRDSRVVSHCVREQHVSQHAHGDLEHPKQPDTVQHATSLRVFLNANLRNERRSIENPKVVELFCPTFESEKLGVHELGKRQGPNCVVECTHAHSDV